MKFCIIIIIIIITVIMLKLLEMTDEQSGTLQTNFTQNFKNSSTE